MADRFFITRDKYGYKYRENTIYGWNHFDNSVIDYDSLMNYLTRGGRLNKPDIVFTNERGVPVKLYEVNRKNGNIMVTIDGKDQMQIARQSLLSDSEAADWFKQHEVSEITIEEADAKPMSSDRLKHYQDNASPSVLEMYDRFYNKKLSDEGVLSFLEKQAATYNLIGEIIFKDAQG